MVETVQPTSGTRETTRLISSEKVEDTSVENIRGDSLGHIEEIMIDKISGKVAYAVLNYGSFLGLTGGKNFAVPWDMLKYNTQRNAYVIDIPEDRLKNAPSFDAGTQPKWGDRDYDKQLHDYYGSRSDWYLSGY
jgi:sporulation protein YlmC with PRC-barrel domain